MTQVRKNVVWTYGVVIETISIECDRKHDEESMPVINEFIIVRIYFSEVKQLSCGTVGKMVNSE